MKTNKHENKIYFIYVLLLNFSNFTSASENLDTSFGENNTGIVLSSINVESKIYTTQIQSDGKIIVGGYSTNGGGNYNTLARYNTNGSIDKTFGTNGFVVNMIGFTSIINNIAIQKNNYIVAGGTSSTGTINLFTLTRYTADGSLDSTFGINGTTTTTIGNAFVKSIAIQSDGKILAGGSAVINGKPNFAVARYNTNGSLDTTFNGTGISTLLIGKLSVINSIAIQSDGKIVVAGFATDVNLTNQFTIARYNSNGKLDTTFGNNGTVVTSTGTESMINSLAIQNNGKIIAAGNLPITNQILLIRYSNDGSVDKSFGMSGKVVTSLGQQSTINAINIDSNGNIIAAGTVLKNEVNNFGIIRYTSNGSIDKTFGNNGEMIITTQYGAFGNSIAIQNDGQILVGGYTNFGYFSTPRFALIKVNKSNNQYITLNSLTNKSIINTRRPKLQGTSSPSKITAQILIDGILFATGTTSTTGAWNFGQTNILTGGTHVIEADLFLTGNKIASSDRQIIINATDSVTVTSPVNNVMSPNNHPTISGTSTLANTNVLVFLDGKYFNFISTDSNGNWNAGVSSALAGGNHAIVAFLVNGSGNTIATTTCKFTV